MTDNVISENFSENEKPKRGRPRKEIWYNKKYQACVNGLIPQTGFRTFQNRYYRMDAIKVLCDDNYDQEPRPFLWILGTGENGTGQKTTVLTELGRLYAVTNDADDLKQFAAWLCEKKPKTRDIIKIICKIRLDYKKESRCPS